MKLTTTYTNKDQTISRVVYEDSDDFSNLDASKVKQVYAVCLCKGKMLVVLHGKRNEWGLPGGSIEEGETFEDCLKREIKEETNTHVVWNRPIGYQSVETAGEEIYQLRYVCVVEQIGEFEGDIAKSITDCKPVDPTEYRKYFDWGDIGERIINRAFIISSTYKTQV